MSEKTAVPALDRGLDILELLATSGPVSYTAIVERLAVPQASAARIIKCLCLRGYAVKDQTGAYRLGPAVAAFQPTLNPIEQLCRAGTPVVKQLQKTFSQTALLFYFHGETWECVAKAAHEDSISMQNVGELRKDIFEYPWGFFAHEQLLKEGRGIKQKVDSCRLKKQEKQYHDTGSIVESNNAFTRIAAPIRDSAGNLVGALAMGVIQPSLTAVKKRGIAEQILAGCQIIQEHFERSSDEQ